MDFSDKNDEQCAIVIDIKGFLMKPVAASDLTVMVRKALNEVRGSTFDYIILFATVGG
jgi:hypothetical protein